MRTPTKRHQVFVRVDDEELSTIKELAARFGVNLPTALRMAAKLAHAELVARRRSGR